MSGLSHDQPRIALLFEHPTWSNDLIARLVDLGALVTPIDVGDIGGHGFGPEGQHDLWINRVNIMPQAGRSPSIVAATSHLLLSLELRGQRVINGSRAHLVGASKAAQTTLFDHLGLATPNSVAVQSILELTRAAELLRFPILVKPNVGGSGRGISRFETMAEIAEAMSADTVDLGLDGTGIVQEYVESADGLVHRVEFLGSDVFYATQQTLQPGLYNYCAANGGVANTAAAAGADRAPIEIVAANNERVDDVRRILAGASADVGGVEYLIDQASGRAVFFDFNPYSNFLTGRDEELGFDPIDRYLNWVLAQVPA